MRVQATPQADIWLVQEQDDRGAWTTKGAVATYVDDVLMVGEEEIIQGFIDQVKMHWKIGEPEWVREGREPVRFLGMEIERKGQDFAIHQRAYLESLFMEYDEQGKASLGQIKTPEEEENPQLTEVTQAQKETGELLWVAGRTRPDVCLAVSIMCQWATKRPRAVMAIGKQVRAYLRQTRGEVLYISGTIEEEEENENGLNRVEVYSDASYASSDMKSLTGVVVCVGGTPITWHTTRQAFITLSTAEAELMSLLESLICGRSAGSLMEAILGPGPTALRFDSSYRHCELGLHHRGERDT